MWRQGEGEERERKEKGAEANSGIKEGEKRITEKGTYAICGRDCIEREEREQERRIKNASREGQGAEKHVLSLSTPLSLLLLIILSCSLVLLVYLSHGGGC